MESSSVIHRPLGSEAAAPLLYFTTPLLAVATCIKHEPQRTCMCFGGGFLKEIEMVEPLIGLKKPRLSFCSPNGQSILAPSLHHLTPIAPVIVRPIWKSQMARREWGDEPQCHRAESRSLSRSFAQLIWPAARQL